jgi:hypothetical protein
MTIFGLSLFQVFLLVLVTALAIVVAEQIRKHGLDPFLAMLKQKFTQVETAAVNEFETLLGHAKATAAALPAGSTVEAKTGTSAVNITTPSASDDPHTPTPLDPVQAVARYIKGGMTPAQGMPNLHELLWLNALSKAAQVAWGTAVAAAFDAQLAKPTDGSNPGTAGVGDIGDPAHGTGIRVEAQVYLLEVGGGFPIVGTINWLKS